MIPKTNAYERECEREIRANPNLNPKHTTIWSPLTGRIIYSLTSQPSFEYDTWEPGQIIVRGKRSKLYVQHAMSGSTPKKPVSNRTIKRNTDQPSMLVFLTVGIFHQKARPANFQKTHSHSSKFFFVEGQKSSFKIKLIVSDLLLGWSNSIDLTFWLS